VVICDFKPRGQVPSLFPRIPGDGRLEEKAAAFHEVGYSLPTGTKHEQHFLLVPGDNLASRIAAYLLVKNAAVPALDRVLQSMALERRQLASITGVTRRECVHGH
jgi:hypothetical protein